MANPRQRRKSRSSSHRAVTTSKQKNLKKMPAIRGPKVLQQAWDNKRTVRQNYAALGLIHDLNPSESGGAEIVEQDRQTNSGIAPESSIDLTAHSTSTNTSSTDPGTSLRIYASDSAIDTNPKKLSKGHGRIVRDEAGNVLRVELHEEDLETESSALRDDVDMEQLAPQLESNIRQTWVSELGGLKTRLATNK